MIKVKKNKHLFEIKFKKEDLEDDDQIIYEDLEYIISLERLKNFVRFTEKYSDIVSSKFKSKELITFEVPLRKENETYQVIDNQKTESLLTYRHSLSSLLKPFILKRSLLSNNKIKNYQIDGVKWLLEKPCRILADDMGLGKTFQAITAASKKIIEGGSGTVLIICPSSLVFNWCREIEKWLPDFKTSAFINTGKKKEEIWNKLFGYNHFVITNYEQLRNFPKSFSETSFDLIIADEAHKLRKGSSKLYNSLSNIKYKSFWALTGTPIENNQRDACHIMKLVDPSRNLSSDLELSNVSLRSQLRSYSLRRLKSSVLKDLKSFQEKTYEVELSSNQKDRYKKILDKNKASKLDHLSTYNKLREICDLDIETMQSSKINFILDLLEKIKLSKEKVVIFSFWLNPLFALKEEINKVFGFDASVLYTGELEKEEREDEIMKFKNNKETFVFLCSGKIGGEGINLTEANHAIFFNRWWNPSNNSQARDRIIRIGQNKNAFIYNLITTNTIEEKLTKILKDKNEISKDIIEKIVISEHGG